jgi:hypothetical protein
MKKFTIPREALRVLAFGLSDNITTHDLATWLESKTNSQFTVIDSDYIKDLLEHYQYLRGFITRLERDYSYLMSNLKSI